MSEARIETQPSCEDDYDNASLSCAAALERLLAATRPLEDTEQLPVRAALGRVLARAIASPFDVPAHTNSAMDGYALRGADIPKEGLSTLRVVGASFAGKPFHGVLRAGEELRGVQVHRAITAARSGHQGQLAPLVGHGEMLLFIAGRHTQPVRQDPDLQKVRGLIFGVVEFAVRDAAARAHALHIARRNADDVAHAVLVREVAGQHVADDFHVAMAVLAEAGARRDTVFIDDAQIAEAHVRRIVIVGKRERVVALQPAVVGVTAFL